MFNKSIVPSSSRPRKAARKKAQGLEDVDLPDKAPSAMFSRDRQAYSTPTKSLPSKRANTVLSKSSREPFARSSLAIRRPSGAQISKSLPLRSLIAIQDETVPPRSARKRHHANTSSISKAASKTAALPSPLTSKRSVSRKATDQSPRRPTMMVPMRPKTAAHGASLDLPSSGGSSPEESASEEADEGDESSDETSDSSDAEPTHQDRPLNKAARKMQDGYGVKTVKRAADPRPPAPAPAPAPPMQSNNAHVLDRKDPEAFEMLEAAIERNILRQATVRARRPPLFMVRNIRKEFLTECRVRNLSSQETSRSGQEDPTIDYTVTFQLEDASAFPRPPTLRKTLDAWCCPLCDLHGSFPTRDILSLHLERTHLDVRIQATKPTPYKWHIDVYLPSGESSERTNDDTRDSDGAIEGVQDEHIEISDIEPVKTGGSQVHDIIEISDSGNERVYPNAGSAPSKAIEISDDDSDAPTTSEDEERRLELSIDAQNSTIAATGTTQIQAAATQIARSLSPLAAPKWKFDWGTREPVVHAMSSVRAAPDPTPQRKTPSNKRPASLPVYLPDPPEHDPLGPAAQRPYLPFPPTEHYEADPELKARYRKVEFSTRPGGEKIYDLITCLRLDEFGPLIWQVVDREEEIFEMDDGRDEDKVISALWGRWIMLNRNEFVKDYTKGAKTFVERYWEMIYMAAGWRALRAWLFVLLSNRFLNVNEVLQVLRRYEELIGMDHWVESPSKKREGKLSLGISWDNRAAPARTTATV